MNNKIIFKKLYMDLLFISLHGDEGIQSRVTKRLWLVLLSFCVPLHEFAPLNRIHTLTKKQKPIGTRSSNKYLSASIFPQVLIGFRFSAFRFLSKSGLKVSSTIH